MFVFFRLKVLLDEATRFALNKRLIIAMFAYRFKTYETLQFSNKAKRGL